MAYNNDRGASRLVVSQGGLQMPQVQDLTPAIARLNEAFKRGMVSMDDVRRHFTVIPKAERNAAQQLDNDFEIMPKKKNAEASGYDATKATNDQIVRTAPSSGDRKIAENQDAMAQLTPELIQSRASAAKAKIDAEAQEALARIKTAGPKADADVSKANDEVKASEMNKEIAGLPTIDQAIVKGYIAKFGNVKRTQDGKLDVPGMGAASEDVATRELDSTIGTRGSKGRAEVTTAGQGLSQIDQGLQEADAVDKIFKSGVGVGPIEGSAVGRAYNQFTGTVSEGRKNAFNNTRTVEQFVTKRGLEATLLLKGAISNREFDRVFRSVPTATDYKETWDAWYKNYREAAAKAKANIEAGLTPEQIEKLDASSATNTAGAAPAAGKVRPPTEDEYKAMVKGTVYLGSDGKWHQKQ